MMMHVMMVDEHDQRAYLDHLPVSNLVVLG